jgi:hypothetical protein
MGNQRRKKKGFLEGLSRSDRATILAVVLFLVVLGLTMYWLSMSLPSFLSPPSPPEPHFHP